MSGSDATKEKDMATPEVHAEVVDHLTGEVLAIREEPPAGFSGYLGVASLAVPQAEAVKLMEKLPDENHDILPTGEVYVAQVHYRRLLNGTFGPGSWALVPRGEFIKQGKTLCREYALVVRGRFVAEAVGEQDYHESNERMSYASAAEGVKSNALTRCCKDLGIASECWDKRWCEAWIAKYAVQVWLEKSKDGKAQKPQWRRKDAKPFWNEQKGRGQQPSAPPPTVLFAGAQDRADDVAASADPFGDALDGPDAPDAERAPTGPEIPTDTTAVISLKQRRFFFGKAKELGYSEPGIRKAVGEVRLGNESTEGMTSSQMDRVLANLEAAARGEATR